MVSIILTWNIFFLLASIAQPCSLQMFPTDPPGHEASEAGQTLPECSGTKSLTAKSHGRVTVRRQHIPIFQGPKRGLDAFWKVVSAH